MLLANFLLLLASLLAVFVAALRARAADEANRRTQQLLADRESGSAEDEALAAIGLMTGDLCEEVIPPITVILGQCELMRAGGEAASPRMRTIEAQARRIARAVEHHRGFAPNVSPTPLDARALAREAVLELEPVAQKAGVMLHPLFEDVPSVAGNPLLLKRALRQMVRTAIVAAGDSGMGDVTVAVGELDDGVGLCVADDGPGMDELQCQRVFAPAADDRKELRGTSANYALVQAIAGATGATLLLDTAPGEGTRATLRLPLAVGKKEGLAMDEPSVGAPDGNRTHISSLGSWRSTTELQAQPSRRE